MKIEMDTENTCELSWCRKLLKYLKNRNQIGPGKVELCDCDFFIVGPRRTLRILRPVQKNSEYYDTINGNRPESINENFITKWTKKPHSLYHCRCSFRRQSSQLNTPEDRIISAQINRIRTSLCEAEKSGENLEEVEKRISMTFNCQAELINPEVRDVDNDNDDVNDRIAEIANNSHDIDDSAVKSKIIKDLEKYIDKLLKQVLNDTMTFISNADDTLKRSREALSDVNQTSEGSLNISFAFPEDHLNHGNVENIIDLSLADGGYVNEGFIGSTHDPDCLNFDLGKPMINANIDPLDCVDSGINSVETMEFQPDPGLSLEQSLMKIIDAKFGKGPLTENWDNTNTQENYHQYENSDNNINSQVEAVKKEEFELTTVNTNIISDYNKEAINKLTDDNLELLNKSTIDDEFGNLTLQFTDNNSETSIHPEPSKKFNAVAVLCEKFTSKLGKNGKNHENNEKEYKLEEVKLRKLPTIWKNDEESSAIDEETPNDLVMFRRNRKPIIVFIHGFGSSAEVFQHQLKYFSQMGYPCIAPDLLGHGMSSAPGRSRDYRFDKLLNDLEAILHHYAFKSEQKCVLVAHNYGCSFATALACKYENEIQQLVLISGGGPTALAPPSTEGPGHCCMRAMLSPLLMCGLHRDILYSARGRQHPYCGTESEDQWPSHMKYILDGMIWPEGDYVFHRRICTPTLLIHGLRDNKVSLVQECQMERTIVKAFLEAIPTAGHMPMTETPDQVNHMIHCFIDLWKKK